MAGLWELPGGKIEVGESPESALVRELTEELGLVLDETSLIPLTFASHRYESFHLLMPVFACKDWQGVPVAHEGQALAWVPPEGLDRYPCPAADLPVFAAIRRWME